MPVFGSGNRVGKEELPLVPSPKLNIIPSTTNLMAVEKDDGKKKTPSLFPSSKYMLKRNVDVEKDVEKGPNLAIQPSPSSSNLQAADKKEKTKSNVKTGDDDKLEYDPEDDVWSLDECKPSVGRKYARSLVEAFHPVLYISICLGLFPLHPKRAKDGTYTVQFSWFSFATIPFLLVATLVVGSTLWMLISIFCISINLPEAPNTEVKSSDIYRSEEIFVYKRNVVNFVAALTSFVHLTICMLSVLHRREYIAKQLVYWTEVVELLQLDVGHNVGKRLCVKLLIVTTFGCALVTAYVLKISPGLTGAGSTFYVLMARVINPVGHWHTDMKIRGLIFAIFQFYCIFGGYMYILWFSYNCIILTNILRIWNNRFQYCLHKHILGYTGVQQSKDVRLGVRATSRTSRANLFQDHLVIFNLLEGVNAQFEVILESFYLGTMVMIVIETYGVVHACFYYEYVECHRQWDVIPFLLFLTLQVYLYISVTLEATGVADEARHVLDVCRRKGMMTSRVDNELWFMLSMSLSFGGHEDVGIIGGGFIYVTKAFLLGAIGAMASHFIIFYQFEIPYSQTVEGDENFARLDVKKLIEQLEGSSALC